MIALLSYAGWQFQKIHVYQIHPQVLQKNNSYVFDADNHDNKFILRQSFYIDPTEFKNKLTVFEPIGKEAERRMMYKDLMSANEKRLKEFFIQFT